MNPNTTVDTDFKTRIENALKTVQAWEDPPLLADCRATIPFDDLRNDQGPYSSQEGKEENDQHSSYSLIFFQRFCRYFQKSMTWVNQPSCPHCKHSAQFVRTRGPETIQERQGQASRVELYQCNSIHCTSRHTTNSSTIAFPRYNDPRTLLQTRQGRCGEYANLFGLYCRAAGYSTRYILDVTDHVWVEVSIPRRRDCCHGTTAHSSPATATTATTYDDTDDTDDTDDFYCMGDGCEGVINEPSMYEKGWGKQLSYVIAVTPTYVMDVTPRYTRQFASEEFLARRRTITSSEEAGCDVIQQINATLFAKLSSLKQRQTIQKQCIEEEEGVLSHYKQMTEWKNDYAYHQGRISGAMEWKVTRGEIGLSRQEVANSDNDTSTATVNHQQQQSTEYSIQTFLPCLDLSQAYIAIHPQPPLAQPTHAIVVSGAPCAMGIPNRLSAVFVDPQQGTILQSKSLVSLQHLEWLVKNSIFDTQILVVHGRLLKRDDNDGDGEESTNSALRHRLPLWKNEYVWDGGIMYMGVVGQTSASAAKKWTVCAKLSETVEPVVLRWNSSIAVKKLKLRIHRSTRPNVVVGRLPDSSLPLATQITSTFAQKQAAFESFVQTVSTSSSSSQQCSSIVGFCTKPGAPIYLISAKAYPLQPCMESSDGWATFVLLPAWLVPASDDVGATALDPVPMSLSYEVPLEVKGFVERLGPQLLVNESQTMDTAVVLQKKNPRLIAFYFSAHWCGPCRSFTPVLVEFYHVLNEAFPSHGLEIVFVSSDRDPSTFQTYYRTMPWLAVPFTLALEQYKSTLSFQFNIQGIPSLVVMDPISGAVVVDARTSRGEIQQCCRRGDDAIIEQFGTWLSRLPAESRETLNLLQLSCHEMQVTSTAEKDHHEATMLAKYVYNDTTEWLENCLVSGELSTVDDWEVQWRNSQRNDWKTVIKTALQYVTNARREPWNPKYRAFHWSNAVADRINGVLYGLEWWCLQGLEVYSSRDDYIAWIPVHIDLDALHVRWSALLDDGTKGS